MKIKTSKLTGTVLDWAATKALGLNADYWLEMWLDEDRRISCSMPSSQWSYGGPIIEREGIDIQQVFGGGSEGSFSQPVGWQAQRHTAGGTINPKRHIAQTPLIAAMRCFVASKLGDEVEIPEELI